MTFFGANLLLAIATAVLAAGAIVTAVFAVLAFKAQSREVKAIEEQVTDQKELTTAQAALLGVQSDQLKVQQDQLADQRDANARQAEVLKLQADELRESLDERKQEAEQRRRAQATRVFIWEERFDSDPGLIGYAAAAAAQEGRNNPLVVAYVVNSSEQPVYDLAVNWHRGTAPWGPPDRWPALMPGEEKKLSRSLPADLPQSVDRSQFGAVAYFRDAAGVRWRSRPDGQLDEQP